MAITNDKATHGRAEEIIITLEMTPDYRKWQ